MEKVVERKLVAKRMKLYPEKCTGCLQCMLACSFRYDGIFNPLKARTGLERDSIGIVTKILLSPECTFCGHCVTVCHYGARILKEES